MKTLIVIGGGPAGMTAALEAAILGAAVTLVSAESIGGRANGGVFRVGAKTTIQGEASILDTDHAQQKYCSV